MFIEEPEFIKSLDGWIGENDQKYAKILALNKAKIPPMFRTYTGSLYRGMTVEAKFIEELQTKGYIDFKGYTSWTKDKSIALKFINDDKYKTSPRGNIKVLIEIKANSKVILDINGYAYFMGINGMINAGIDDMSADSAYKEKEVLCDVRTRFKKENLTLV